MDVCKRLTSVIHNGRTLASYAYASNGIHSSMAEGGVTTNFTLDGRLCVAENSGTGPLQSMFGPTGALCRGAQ